MTLNADSRFKFELGWWLPGCVKLLEIGRGGIEEEEEEEEKKKRGEKRRWRRRERSRRKRLRSGSYKSLTWPVVFYVPQVSLFG